jgi:hypothetical protein
MVRDDEISREVIEKPIELYPAAFSDVGNGHDLCFTQHSWIDLLSLPID